MFAGTILQDLKGNSVMTSEPRALETVLEQLQAERIKIKDLDIAECVFSVYRFLNGLNLFIETDFGDKISHFFWVTEKDIAQLFDC